ncbi:tripartite tricarboxylate transporter TctB family protein [Noviherbaspirillum sedimenti]|uniref:Tripartite tricarboxylate transporter TctB family protein n=1 Tax=Noviherbaspirillum sedimenti TaxID=2320865 RepID=A0A3A3G5F0_9BURK|nr:tripartite tricarboxylate transporter TctB family protein [Noviherbaspirillum sedimenti]RJG03727.1 tripartite tricarboxylate transporter TctB family protein [Noviherbaspirillum sedimenti]
MPSIIRHPKDFWTGVIFLALGLAAMIIGRDYPMGTAGRMGPAYFPTVLGGLLALVGAAAVGRSFFRSGEAVEKFAVKQLLLILAAVLLFGFLIRGAGLVVAVMTTVAVSAFAYQRFRPVPVLLLAGGLVAFSVLVFVKLLGLPIAIVGPWFGA